MKQAQDMLYGRYVFRSVTEARWALFFDKLGIDYEYEPTKFSIPGIGGYVPDFYLPNVKGGTWIEIKGKVPNPTEEAKAVGVRMLTKASTFIFSDVMNVGVFSDGVDLCNFGIYVATPDGVFPIRPVMAYKKFLPDLFERSEEDILITAIYAKRYDFNEFSLERGVLMAVFRITRERDVKVLRQRLLESQAQATESKPMTADQWDDVEPF